jgi:hypothetical protein
MNWYYGIIKKNGEVVLARTVKELPKNMQNLVSGSDDFVLGAYNPADKKIYIYLPDIKRYVESTRIGGFEERFEQEGVELDTEDIPELSDERLERLIINKLLDTITHETLHLAMDDEIIEWVKGQVGNFNRMILRPILRRFMDNPPSPQSAFARLRLTETGGPEIEKIIEKSTSSIVHEILVRMLLQKDMRESSRDLRGYVHLYAKATISTITRLALNLPDYPEAEDDINSFYQVMLTMLTEHWAEYIGYYYNWNIEYTTDLIRDYVTEVHIDEMRRGRI